MEVDTIFILISAIISIGFISNYFFKKTKIPDVLWLVIFGFLITHVFGIVDTSRLWEYLPLFSTVALMLILFDSASRIDIYKLIKETPDIFLLTSLCFMLSFSFVTFLLTFGFGIDMRTALIIGVIIGGTSSGIVLPVIDLIKNIRKEISIIMKLEAVLTDPLVIIVALVLLQASYIEMINAHKVLVDVIQMLSTSIVIGFSSGIIWGVIWYKIGKADYHYILTLAFLLLLFVFANFIGGNGAITVFFFGLILGNIKKIKHMFKLEHSLKGLTKDLMEFNSYITFFIKTLFFSLIGMSMQLYDVKYMLIAIAVSAILLLARYISINIFSIVEKLSKKEKWLMTLMYPRGLAAAVLATMVKSYFVSQIIFGVIFYTVVVSTIGILIFERKKEN